MENLVDHMHLWGYLLCSRKPDSDHRYLQRKQTSRVSVAGVKIDDLGTCLLLVCCSLHFQVADSLHVDVRRQIHDVRRQNIRPSHRAHVPNSHPLYALLRVHLRLRVCVSYTRVRIILSDAGNTFYLTSLPDGKISDNWVVSRAMRG